MYKAAAAEHMQTCKSAFLLDTPNFIQFSLLMNIAPEHRIKNNKYYRISFIRESSDIYES